MYICDFIPFLPLGHFRLKGIVLESTVHLFIPLLIQLSSRNVIAAVQSSGTAIDTAYTDIDIYFHAC